MDNSTQNVTLFAHFITDILALYEHKKDGFAKPLFDMAQPYNLTNPLNKVPIQLFNDMCAHIENKLGPANLQKTGETLGEAVFDNMIKQPGFPKNPTPEHVIRGIVQAAQDMIQDPKKRGFDILESKPKHLLLRRTQTFNSIFQIGLFKGLVRKTNARLVDVKFVKTVAQGHPYDEYLITWV